MKLSSYYLFIKQDRLLKDKSKEIFTTTFSLICSNKHWFYATSLEEHFCLVPTETLSAKEGNVLFCLFCLCYDGTVHFSSNS